jgi:integrase
VLAAKLAPSTVHTVYAVLRSLMQSAVEDQLIPANPCSRVPLPRLDKPVVVPLSAGAVSALAAAMPPRYELAVWLAAGAGLREGEALGLTVPRVEFLARRLVVAEQMQNKALSPLKTRASRRVVPVDDLVLSAVTAHMQRWQPRAGQVLITNRLGRPVQRNSFGFCWREAVTEAGLPAGTRFHDLRHFYASTLIAAGLHPKVIQERLGHATIAETMDTYGHLFPDASEQGRGALDAMFAPADVRPMCARQRS